MNGKDNPARPTGPRPDPPTAEGMLSPGEPPKLRLADGLWAALFLLTSAPASWENIVRNQRGWDSSLFLWIGKRLLRGDVLYRDIWDNKLPPVYWANAFAAATGHPEFTIWILNVLGMTAAAWMIYRIASTRFGSFASGLAGLTYVSLYATRYLLNLGSLTEHFAAPLAVLGVFALVQYARGQRPGLLWAAVSGFAIAAAALFRLPAVLVAASLAALLPGLHRSGRLKPAAVLLWLGGALLATAPVLGWAAWEGNLRLMLEFCVFGGARYAFGSEGPRWATWGHVGAEWLNMLSRLWPWHVPAAVGLAICLRGRLGASSRSATPGPRGLSWLAVVWLAAAVASTLPSLRFYDHYYVLVVGPLALLSAWAWQALWRMGRRGRAAGALAAGVLLAGGLLALNRYRLDHIAIAEHRLSARHIRPATEYLASAGSDRDTLFAFVWGVETDVQARLGWPCNTKHPIVRFYPHMPGGMAMMREWKQQMLQTPPDWLIACDGFDLVAGTVRPRSDWDRPETLAMVREIARAYRGRYRPVKVLPLRPERQAVSADPRAAAPAPVMVIYRRLPEDAAPAEPPRP